MSTGVSRPRGVLVVAILLFIVGAFNIVVGTMALIPTVGAEMAASSSEEQRLAGLGIAISAGSLLIGVLNIVFAIGILRGNRVARLLVTIIQAITIIVGVLGLASATASHDITRYVFTSLVTPLMIIVLLWIGEQTKAFFARTNQ